MPGIRIHLYEWAENDSFPLGSHGPAAAPVTSDSEGHFAFTGLQAGDYVLQAELEHEVYPFGESADLVTRHTVPVRAEFEGRNILFRILPRAALRGVVRDERGEIVEHSTVAIYRRDRRGGLIELMPAGGAGVDDGGRYAITGLWPGDYAVCAEPPEPALAYFAPSGESEIEYRPGGEDHVYTESCYSDPESHGALLHLSSGVQQHLDLTLRAASSVTLRTNVNFALYRPDPPRPVPVKASDTTGPVNERWQIRNVPPGNYVVYALFGGDQGDPDGPGSVVRKPVTVGSQPLELELHPEKRGKINVRLRGGNGEAMNDSAAAVWLYRFDATTLMDRYYLTGLRYSFDPGEYWLSVAPKPPFCVTSQTLSGGTLRNGKITVTPGMSAQLDLELGGVCSTIGIQAMSNGVPAPFASFLLLVNGTPEEPGQVVTGNLDAHGKGSIPRMPPGRYLLWAWEPRPDGYLGPDLASPESRPVEVMVRSGQPAMVSIDPLRSPGVRK